MAEREINGRMIQRQDTAANWESKNPILSCGEFGYDTTKNILKIGDGVHNWNALDSFSREPALPPQPLNLEAATWQEIALISERKKAQEYFAVGDRKTIALSTNEKISVLILGFDHDVLSKTEGMAGISFGMENLLATAYRMNPTNGNTGGWDGCEMRNNTLHAIFSQMPSDLQSVVKTVDKKATEGNMSVNIATSTDKLFLFSEKEITNTNVAGFASEGIQYQYWKELNDGTADGNRIKNLSNGTGNASAWWLRSPILDNVNPFASISATGAVGRLSSNTISGVCFGFCV